MNNSTFKDVYRDYHITHTGKLFWFQHRDFDCNNPGDKRFGQADTIKNCKYHIDKQAEHDEWCKECAIQGMIRMELSYEAETMMGFDMLFLN